jgi:hypothetical protein
MPNDIYQQIKNKDYGAQATAVRLGAAASPLIRPLAADPDREVRLLAFVCLDLAGGPDAIAAAFDGLRDTDQQVRSRAVMLLLNHPPKEEQKKLLAAFKASKDQFVRSRLPLVAGRLAPEISPRDWVVLLPLDTDPEVQHGLHLGLARMGDQGSRDWFLQGLKAAHGYDLSSWLEDAEYIDQPWVLPSLVPLLDRTERALDVMPDDGQNRYLRACDLAAKTIITITHAKVSFPFPRPSQLSSIELEEVKRLVPQH